MANKGNILGHSAAFIAYAIFGFNIIVCKDLTSGGLIPPLGIFTLRSLIAGGLFWLVSLFLPKEKIDKNSGKHTVRNLHDHPEQSQFLDVPWHLQASDNQIFGCDIHEMDIPVLGMRGYAPITERAYKRRLGRHPVKAIC